MTEARKGGKTGSKGSKPDWWNRKKKEKSMLRGNLYVLDLFVRVPPGVRAPVTYSPMEDDAINQVADGRERGKRVTFHSSRPTSAGGVSVEDRSKRTGALRPQLDERCGKQRECNSGLNATSDEENNELNGETVDEDDGRTGERQDLTTGVHR